MIKQCPTCKRTYSDETISFCLADGALLSPPFERESTESPSVPDTLVMPPPTQAAPMRTITAQPQKVLRQTATDEEPKSSKLPLIFPLAAIAIVAVVLVVGYFLWASSGGEGSEVATVNVLPTPEVAMATPASPTPTTQEPTPTPTVTPLRSSDGSPTPASSPTAKSQDRDPVLFPPETKPAGESKIYSSSEVDQRVRILSQPKPAYTEEARKNQINGTVVLQVVFAANGAVTNIRAISGLGNGLTEQAIAAARQIKFEPATKGGAPVSVRMQVQYNFSLY